MTSLEDRTVPAAIPLTGPNGGEWVKVDTLTIATRTNPTAATGVQSNVVLDAGTTYLAVAHGTARIATDATGFSDAEYIRYNKSTGPQDGSSPGFAPNNHGVRLAGVDGGTTTGNFWGTYQSDHQYVREVTGQGTRVTSYYSDIPGYYGDNSGTLTVNLYAEVPLISVTSTDTAEGGVAGVFTFTRTSDLSQSLVVAYAVSGTATLGADYTFPVGGTVTFAPGESTATVNAAPITDGVVEPTEDVVLTIAPSPAYAVGATGSATMRIFDEDVPPGIDITYLPELSRVLYVPPSGTTNAVTITGGSGLTVTDAGVSTIRIDPAWASLFSGSGNSVTFTGLVTSIAVRTGDGNDTVDASALSASDPWLLADGGDGNDLIFAGAGNDILNGGAGDDTLISTNGADTLEGGLGADLLDAGDVVFGAGLIVGGVGDDTIIGSNLPDEIYGGDGNDVILGFGGVDEIYGGDGDDAISGGDGNDFINGGGNDDVIFGDGGNDYIDAGSGNDTVYGDSDAFGGSEDGDGDDTILGGDGFDNLYGNGGIDRLNGGLLADALVGGDGGDILVGEDGNDTISGGIGNDSISGSAGDDLLLGEDNDDLLRGGAGNDTILGGSNDDTMFGGANDDVLLGGDDNDEVYGDGGNDNVAGGNGSDSLDGGLGNDVLQESDNAAPPDNFSDELTDVDNSNTFYYDPTRDIITRNPANNDTLIKLP